MVRPTRDPRRGAAPRVLAVIALAAAAVLATACGRSAGPGASGGTDEAGDGPVGIDDLRLVRDYEVEVTVAEPQAEWDPGELRFVTRGLRGIMLFTEGVGAKHYRTDDTFSPWDPRWTLSGDVVYGPKPEPVEDKEGTVVMPSHGLFIARAADGTLGRPETLTDTGYRPRPWLDDRIVASVDNQIVFVDEDGEIESFGEGFLPVPQRGGQGLIWQETPIFHRDWWTGIEGIGDLVIRWRPGVIDTIPRALQAQWTPDGGVVATVLRGEIKQGAPWFLGGTDVVHIPGPGRPVRIVRRDSRDPAPHPAGDFLAVVGIDDRVHLVSYDGERERPIAEIGERPRWSSDGRRLLVREPHPEHREGSIVRVMVFTVPH